MVDATPRACPLCRGNRRRVVLDVAGRGPTGRTYSLVQCMDCTLRYTIPVPTVEEFERLYSSDYYVSGDACVRTPDFARVLLQRSILNRNRTALLGRSPGRVLDVGCGNGEFLLYLKQRGWLAYGTDVSAAACELARRKGIEVRMGELRSARYPGRFFDVVMLSHVLEHVLDPPDELAEVRRVLADDGILVVQVPNSDSWTFRLCRSAWYPLDVPRHLQHFTPRTLELVLTRAGFSSARRWNFHHWDFTYIVYSFLRWIGAAQRYGIETFSRDFASASLRSKLAFACAAAVATPVAMLYSVLSVALTGNGETLTVTARR